ncbi:MAG: response regulator [Candidatus Spechtbacteria bacterium]|nr:response regulator [Candidatus Spechtbacteria bacterium]
MARILIIEDEPTLGKMLKDKLTKDGYEVFSARDGEEGLLEVRKEKPALVLLDIAMPKLGGMEVLETMHADPELSAIPVIIISNSGEPVEIDRAKSLGVKDYLIKAEFDPKEVSEKVGKVLGNLEGSSMPHRERSKDQKKVLVIEDDQFLRDLIIKKLEEEGFETLQAIDGEEGLRLIREEKPAIVLLDLILPGVDGFEVLKQAKEDAGVRAIPIIILSNLGQKDDIDRGLALGAEDYLIKAHFTPGEIVQKVKDTLR